MEIVKLSENATVPAKATSGSAAFDLASAEDVSIPPNSRIVIKTGLAIRIQSGYYGQIASRSGLCVKSGIITVGGVIDSDYRGEVCVILYNLGNDLFTVHVGDRIAQLLLIPVCVLGCREVSKDEWYARCSIEEKFSAVMSQGRGTKGFGSTGI